MTDQSRVVLALQGSRTRDVPSGPGLYAWYYRPLAINSASQEVVRSVLGRLVGGPDKLMAEVHSRYNVRWRGESDLIAHYGSAGISLDDIIKDVLSYSPDFIAEFLKNYMTPAFSKPLYIGIASDLHERVHRQHYLGLCELWEFDSSVSKYLSGHPNADVQEVLEGLSLNHSFAIEARVRGFSPRDLMVYVCVTDNMSVNQGEDDSQRRRALEQMLQLLADPICGRS